MKRLAMLRIIPELVSRIVIGSIFLESGIGKLQNLPKVVEFFESLQIPLANIQAPMVSALEAICGLLVTLGFFTRLASLPLIGIMMVALLTAKRAEITDYSTLIDQSEFLYIIILTWLAAFGSNYLSVDALRNKKCSRSKNEN